MRTFYTIANMIGLFILLFMIDNTYKQVNIYEEAYNELRLSKAVEYATDMAFTDSLAETDAGLSYVTSMYKSSVNTPLNTANTLNSFDMIMALNYGMSLDASSYQAIEDSIGTMVLAGADGYYITNLEKIGDNETALTWSLKLPYTYEIETIKNGETHVITYGVTLNTESYTRVDMKKNAHTSPSITQNTSFAKSGGEMNESIRNNAVSTTLTDAITYSMEHNMINNGDELDFSVYIPSAQTMSGINQIATPTLLVIMKDSDFAGVHGTQKAALTGIRVIRKIRVLAYTDNAGNKLYSYEYQGASKNPNYTVITHYDSIEEAAKNGYHADMDYIFRKIDYDGFLESQAKDE